MITDISEAHYPQILKINHEFVHWLSPLNLAELEHVLSIATYKRQIGGGQGVLIGYPHDADYPGHKNLTWLRQRTEDFFYIDRVIIDPSAQGKGYGQKLYQDVENYARASGYLSLACEVNIKPDNPGSHKFHARMGFQSLGDADYPQYDAALRYYEKRF